MTNEQHALETKSIIALQYMSSRAGTDLYEKTRTQLFKLMCDLATPDLDMDLLVTQTKQLMAFNNKDLLYKHREQILNMTTDIRFTIGVATGFIV